MLPHTRGLMCATGRMSSLLSSHTRHIVRALRPPHMVSARDAHTAVRAVSLYVAEVMQSQKVGAAGAGLLARKVCVIKEEGEEGVT